MNQEKNTTDWMSKWKEIFDEGTWYIIEKHIKKLTLTNIGRFDRFQGEFDDFTVIIGPKDSGKTTIVLALSFDEDPPRINHTRLIKHDFATKKSADKLTDKSTDQSVDDSIIQIETNYNHDLVFTLDKKETKQTHQCFILDELGVQLTKVDYLDFLNYLYLLPHQIILTANPDHQKAIEEFASKNNHCHIIKL